ncbi:unnamed protein product [Mytilus edulis]|uniref:Uncharacterized protein n=1 Tax=Mytilus edulis TaxID=6550 RepID=A0A8S3V9J8_MYTED|nr:unnamed protein product [Mytilus edulis]
MLANSLLQENDDSVFNDSTPAKPKSAKRPHTCLSSDGDHGLCIETELNEIRNSMKNILKKKTKKGKRLPHSFFHEISKLGVKIEPSEIVAAHRIPGKHGKPRPILVKFMRMESKISILRNRKLINEKLEVRISDDVTKLNQGLLNRLYLHEDVTSACLLKETEFIEKVKGDIKTVIEEYESDPSIDIETEDKQFNISYQLLWDMIKLKVRGSAISFSSFRKKEQNNKEKELLYKISLLDKNS